MTHEKVYKLTIEPQILELLGPSLYTNIYYVLAELIANAYDAQAANVYVILNESDITVEDDGVGMSYADITEHYLAVAKESRISEADSYTVKGDRKRMGRKGVGKLAALSVSENVDVMTCHQGEVSGFVLTRHINSSDNELTAIPEDKIRFKCIHGDGTAIVMRSPQYSISKYLKTIGKNLLKIFPAVSKNFRIHIVSGEREEILDGFNVELFRDLCSIITIGEEFLQYADMVLVGDSHRDELVCKLPLGECSDLVELKNKNGDVQQYKLEILGWVGAYKTSQGRRKEMSDFHDNHISLYANNKLGEFNILPVIGKNKLSEVYIIGELHIDLFEKTELPDMALSNRQGYKTDDPRYVKAIEIIREKLLSRIRENRVHWAALQADEKKFKKHLESLQREKEFKAKIDAYKRSVENDVRGVAERESKGTKFSPNRIGQIVNKAINKHLPDLGLKSAIDADKRKLLISHTGADKDFADVAYLMLINNGIPKREIIYSSCDDLEPQIPRRVDIFDYLRSFFVESYSEQKIFVLFVTSEQMAESWGAMAEVGAAWITKSDHEILNIIPCRPERPLNVNEKWQDSYRDSGGRVAMKVGQAHVYCEAIEYACRKLGYEPKSHDANMKILKELVIVED